MFTPWRNAVQKVRQKTGAAEPALAVILGSGLGDVVANCEILCRVGYHELEGMPKTAVSGHKGELVVGRVAGEIIWFFCGRFHLYEGYVAKEVVTPVVFAAAAGCRKMLLTNAAGAINETFRPGTFMWIADHINMMGDNPLRGVRKNPFIDLCHLYRNELFPELNRRLAAQSIDLNRGVLAGVLGPSYETPAEIRALRTLGADAVSMSTIPETIMAKYLGMEVAGLSFMANAAAGLNKEALDHVDILEAGRAGVEQFSIILPQLLEIWP
ncbi:MAG: purine-nucleoside phosphorylase [Desulfuromonas sp.]|nr:MAG: purine-nucleoside phosphorylase [Desulfuromonas sp.]